MNSGKGLAKELLEAALTVLLAAFVLGWAWSLLRPLLPFLVAGLALFGLARWHRR